MIEMIARIRFESDEIEREDLLAFAALVRAHEDAVICLDYKESSLSTGALSAYWEVTGDDSQQ
jgi:hypothetical protein